MREMRFIAFLSLLLFFNHSLSYNASSENDSFPPSVFKLELTQHVPDIIDLSPRRSLREGHPSSPLFPGKGIHYAFLYVGTPPQRVSVIMDTGSHHTAFPCTGCKCGQHMNPFFDPAKSSTSQVKTCGALGAALGSSNKCFFRQSYSEGSSWHAFKVSDKVFIGGESLRTAPSPAAANFSLPFEFGCTDYESGLFRTQFVDGIMGLSASDETLPFALQRAGVLPNKLFGLCFRHGGGVLTLGGVDKSLLFYSRHSHAHATLHAVLPLPLPPASGSGGELQAAAVQYARLLKPKGWYAVNLLDISLFQPHTNARRSIGGAALAKALGAKGTIVDSGTTDTYLPASLAGAFKAAFLELTGLHYDNKNIKIDERTYALLPHVVYRLEAPGSAEAPAEIHVPPYSYLEKVGAAAGAAAAAMATASAAAAAASSIKNSNAGNGVGAGEYVPRIYLTEGQGAVLGANFINNYYTIFDIDNMRVGFARSDCFFH